MATMLTTIKYYNVPDLDVTSGQAFIFDSAADREAFFAKYLVASENQCQFVRKSNDTIKSSIPIGTLETCNYMSFLNPNYENKIFYGFINMSNILNANVTTVTFSLDWWTTDMFQVEALPSRLLREGLTELEYPTNMMNGGAYPTINNEKFYTTEPLAVDGTLEKEYYSDYVVNKESRDDNDGISELVRDSDGIASGAATCGICFVSPDFDKLDAEGTDNYLNMGKIIKTIRNASDTSYIIKTPYSDNETDSDHWKTACAYLHDPDTGYRYDTQPIVGLYTNGYGASRIGGSSSYQLWNRDFTALGESVPAPYVIIITEEKYINKIIEFLNNLDMTSSIIGVHRVPKEVFRNIFSQSVSTVTDGNKTYQLINRCSAGMFFPQSKKNVYSAYTGITSPKLMFYPYAYMTVSTADGKNNMEYRYENLLKCRDSDGHDFNFLMSAKYDADGPTLIASPQGYKRRHENYTGSAYAFEGNPDESVSDSNWPEVPYVTDAFMAHMAKVSNEIIAGNTMMYQNDIGARYVDAESGLFNANIQHKLGFAKVALDAFALASKGEGSIAGLAEDALNTRNAGSTYLAKKYNFENINREAAMSDDSYAAKGTGLIEGNAVYDNFKHTMPAFAQDNYHAGGTIRPGMVNNMAEFGIFATFHVLKLDVLHKYDEFFKMYGYSTNQYKIPTIFSVVDSTVPASVSTPHWETLQFADRRTVGASGTYNREVFYTQTDNIKISNISKVSEEFIKRLFDSGCLFIRPTSSELS